MKKTEVEPVDGVILHGVDASDSDSVLPIKVFGDAAKSYESGLMAGERNVDSATDGYQVVRKEATPVVLTATSAVTIGGGAASDTHLMGILIIKNATAVTATIDGLENEVGTATTVILTGSTTEDVYRKFDGWVNTKGSLDVTASVADKVVVTWKAF